VRILLGLREDSELLELCARRLLAAVASALPEMPILVGLGLPPSALSMEAVREVVAAFEQRKPWCSER
jgi:hypothetical protein